jgi:tape measure domain-containing protein
VAAVNIQLQLQGDKLVVDKLDKIDRSIRKLASAGRHARSGTRQVKKGLTDIEKAAQKAAKEMTRFQAVMFGTLVARGVTVFTRGFSRAAGAIADFGVEGVKSAASFELLSKQLQGAFKSADGAEGAFRKAAEALAYTTQLAKEGPFQIEDLTKAFVRLKGAGIEGVEGLLEGAQNAVAAFGGTSDDLSGVALALSQIAAKGTLSGQELRQIAERNIPIYKLLQEALGVTGEEFEDLAKAGIESGIALEAIGAALRLGFAGAAESQVDTITGRFTNLKVAIGELQREIVASGLEGLFRDLFKEMADWIDLMRTSGEAEEFGRKLATVSQVLIELLRDFHKLGEGIETTVEAVTGAALAFELIAIPMGALSVAMAGFGVTVPASVAGFKNLGGVLTGIARPGYLALLAAALLLNEGIKQTINLLDRQIEAMGRETKGTNLEIQFARMIKLYRGYDKEINAFVTSQEEAGMSLQQMFQLTELGVGEYGDVLGDVMERAQFEVEVAAKAQAVALKESEQAMKDATAAAEALAEQAKKAAEEKDTARLAEIQALIALQTQEIANRKAAAESRKLELKMIANLKDITEAEKLMNDRLKEEAKIRSLLNKEMKERKKLDEELEEQLKKFADAYADLAKLQKDYTFTAKDVAEALSGVEGGTQAIIDAFDLAKVSTKDLDISQEELSEILSHLTKVDMVKLVQAMADGKRGMELFDGATTDFAKNMKENLIGTIEGTLADTFTSILKGDAVDAWESLWEDLSQMAGELIAKNIGDAISVAMGGSTSGTMFETTNQDGTTTDHRGMANFVAIGGIAAQLAASMGEAQTAAAVSGAVSGAIAGFQMGGGVWGAVIGAVVGAAAAYFGSPSTPDPIGYDFRYTSNERFFSGQSGEGTEGFGQAQQEMNNVFQTVRAGWVSILEIFNMPELFGIIDDISIPDLVGSGYADEIQQRINDYIEITIPAAIADAFRGAIQSGASSLFEGTDFEQGIADFFSVLMLPGNLPAEAQLQQFRDFVNVFVTAAAAIEGLQADNLLRLVNQSAFERAFEGIGDIFGRIDTSMAALAVLPLAEQAGQADKILGLIQSASDAVVGMLEAVAAAMTAIDEAINTQDFGLGLNAWMNAWRASGEEVNLSRWNPDLRDRTDEFGVPVRGGWEDYTVWDNQGADQYLEGAGQMLIDQYEGIMGEIATAVDPAQIQTLTGEAQALLNQILGLGMEASQSENGLSTGLDEMLRDFFKDFGIDFAGLAGDGFDIMSQMEAGSFTGVIRQLLESLRGTAQDRLVELQSDLLDVNERLINALEALILAILYPDGKIPANNNIDDLIDNRRRWLAENDNRETGDPPGPLHQRGDGAVEFGIDPQGRDVIWIPGTGLVTPPPVGPKGGMPYTSGGEDWGEKFNEQIASAGNGADSVARSMMRAASMIDAAAKSIAGNTRRIKAQARTGNIKGMFS